MEVLYEKHITIRRKPKNLKDGDVLLFSHEFSKQIPAAILRFLNNAIIYNELIFNRRKFVLRHIYRLLKRTSFKQKIKTFIRLCVIPKKISKAIWITDELSINYFHWFTDALPKLVASENFLKDHLVLLPKKYQVKTYVIQSLKILNISPLFFDSAKLLRVRQLLLPGYTAPTGNYNKEIINKLRKKFFNPAQNKTGKKLYISRKKALRRKITNEEDVVNLLRQYDFEIHFFEDYDFYKQIELAQQAMHLISLHGAGLTNMVFMQDKGKILELRNEDDNHNNCYFSLASDLGHDYYYLLCKGDKQDTADANFMVNIKELENVIKQMVT